MVLTCISLAIGDDDIFLCVSDSGHLFVFLTEVSI